MTYKQNLKNNTRVFGRLEFFRALIFYVPVWVAFEQRYISLAQLITLEAILQGSQLILELPTGALADLIGRRKSMALGYFTRAIAMIVYAFSTNFTGFLVHALLLGGGEALVSGAQEALLYDTLKELDQENRFAKLSSKYSLIFQITLSAATFIGGVMNNIYFRLPMLGYALALIITSLTCLKFQEPKIDSEIFTFKNYIRQTSQGIREIFKNDHIKQVSLFYIIVGFISWTAMLVYNTTFLTELGFSEFELGSVLSIIRVFNSVVLFRLLHTEKLANRQRVYLGFPILMIVSFLPGIWLTKWLAPVFVAGAMFSSTARWIVLAKYTNQEFASRNRATAISTLSMLIGIIYTLFVFISGPLIEILGGVKYIYSILGLLALTIALPLGIRLAKNHNSDSQ